jgi:hypothetical protein
MGEELYHREEQEVYHHERELREPEAPPPPKPVAAPAVRDITKKVFDGLGLPFSPDANNLVPIEMPTAGMFKVIDESRFAFGKKDPLFFRPVPNNVGRIGIFAAKKGASERAVILVLPKGTAPDSVLAIISTRFSQNADFFQKVGGGDPLSPKVILFLLNSHLRDNHGWASQMLASSKQMAVVYIVRSLESKTTGELGPFATDGAFFRQCLVQMKALTNNSFSFGSVTAMSFSLGIVDLNPFVGAISKHVKVTRVINLDPQHAIHAVRPKGAVAVEFLSGETGVAPGFELIPEARWGERGSVQGEKSIGRVEDEARPARLFSRPVHCQLYAPSGAREVLAGRCSWRVRMRHGR